MLRIYNTLSRSKEPLRPIAAGHVRLYVCGMTVYDYCHLGHARVLVAFDVVVRYLRWRGYRVTYVRNITDVDDKIIRRANETGEDLRALTARFIDAMHEDAAALGVEPPDLEPRATENMDAMIAMIERLIDEGYAYLGSNGDVYYDVSRFAHYGRLAEKRLEDLRAGVRVEPDEAKDDPLDFVLWKRAKPGEPSWDSPWGRGRPGWHIECSAMSTSCLGNHFDIHGGGMDLQFPHHENEIAQSEAATGETFVNLWMHNGFVRVEDEKMSKSLGNFFTVRELLAEHPAEAVRYFLVASHYRSPINYSTRQVASAHGALTRFYTALRGLPAVPPDAGEDDYLIRFREAMDDDFNTPVALAVLFDLAREINRVREESVAQAARLGARLRALAAPLGLLQQDPQSWLQGAAGAAEETPEGREIDRLVEQREAARRARDWATADRIRDDLLHRGILLEDTPDGTTWRRKG